MEPNRRIDDFVTITSQLIDILKKENQALKDHQYSDLKELLEDKTTISRVYETKLQTLEDQPDFLTDSDHSLKVRLTSLANEVNKYVEENGLRLKIAIEANRKVVDLIAEAVRETSQKTETYGSSGSNSLSGGRAESKSIAISLDQTL